MKKVPCTLFCLFLVLSCSQHHQVVKNSSDEGFHTNGQAQAHNEDQTALLNQVKPFVKPEGQGLIQAAIEVGARTASALENNALAIGKLGAENIEKDNEIVDKDKEIANWNSRYKLSQQEWGPRLQRFVEKLIRWIFVWLLVVVVTRVIGMVVTGPVGMVFSLIGTVLWPPTWLHTIGDNLHFRGVSTSFWDKVVGWRANKQEGT